MLNIVLFGPPGAGKGVQGQLLAKRLNLLLISPGNMFREEIRRNSLLGKKIKKIISEGDLLPDGVVIETVQKILGKPKRKNVGFLFDGYPRSLVQTKMLDRQLAQIGEKLDICISLDINPKEAEDRLKGRRAIEQRLDDERAPIRRRIHLYQSYRTEIRPYYHEQKKLIVIDGQGSVEEVNNHINQAIDNYLTTTKAD